MIAAAAALILAILLAGWAVRLLIGPTLHDRALAAHAMALHAALLACALAVLAGRAAWVDIALAIVFGDLAVMAAMLKVFRLRTLQAALAPPPSAEQA